MEPGLLNGSGDGKSDEVPRPRMRRMALHHDRAARGEGRRGVSTRGREREREVAGSEYRHGAEGDVALPDVRSRQRLAVRLSPVDADAEVIAAAYDAGEHAQLAGGAADLTGDAGLRQVALRDGGIDDG